MQTTPVMHINRVSAAVYLVLSVVFLSACNIEHREISKSVSLPANIMQRAIQGCEIADGSEVTAFAIVKSGRFAMTPNSTKSNASLVLMLNSGDSVKIEIESVENNTSSIIATAAGNVPADGDLIFTENDFTTNCGRVISGGNENNADQNTENGVNEEEVESENVPEDSEPETANTINTNLLLDSQDNGQSTNTVMDAALHIEEIVDPSQDLRIEVSVGNIGTTDLEDIRISYRVPEGLSHSATSDANPNSNGCNGCGTGNESYWNISRLSVGATRTFEISSQVSGDLAQDTQIPIRITISSPSLTSSISLERTATIARNPIVEVAITSEKEPVQQGEDTTIKVDFGNRDVTNLNNMKIAVLLPDNVTPNSIDDGGIYNSESNIIQWQFNTIPVLNSVSTKFQLSISNSLPSGSIIPLKAYVVDSDNKVLRMTEFPLTVPEIKSPLTLDVSPLQKRITAGGRVQVALSVSNNSFVPATNVELMLRVPFGISFSSTSDATPNLGSGCNGCSFGNEARLRLNTIQAGSTKTILINLNVDSSLQGGKLIKPYFVLQADQLEDTVVQSTILIVDNAQQIKTSITSNSDALQTGDSLTVDYQIGNISVQPIQDMILTALIPRGVNASTVSSGGTINGNIINWSLGNLNPRATVSRTVEFLTNTENPYESMKFEAIVTSKTDISNLGTATHVVSNSSDGSPVELNINASQETQASATLLYQITIENTGFTPISDLVLTHRVPSFLSYSGTRDTEPDGNGCNGCGDHDEQYWNLPTLESSTSYSIEINATVSSTAPAGNFITSQFLLDGPTLTDSIYEVVPTRIIP